MVKVDSTGKVKLSGENWKVSKAIAGEWVNLVRIENRVLVYYCTTLIREIDLGIQRSTMVERWIPEPNQETQV